MSAASRDTSFLWGVGVEDTFVPQSREHLRPLDEYELTQHYQQWREDLDRAASLGIQCIRWGVPWFKVEQQRGVFDWSWVDDVLHHMVYTARLEPVIDLVHYGTPLWMDNSFANAEYPERVAEFAAEFARRYGKMVRYYVPANEPIVNADFSGRRAEWPPYLSGDAGFTTCLLAIARGMQLSMQAIKNEVPNALFVAVESLHRYRGVRPEWAAEAELAFRMDMLCYDLTLGRVDDRHPLAQWLKNNGASEAQLADLRKDGAGMRYDLLGVNFYPWSSVDVVIDDNGRTRQMPGPQSGRLLAEVLKQTHDFAKTPLVVTETSAFGTLEDRQQWMEETVGAVRDARAAGTPVVGYIWFPMMTMIGWEYRASGRPIDEHLLHLGLWDSAFSDEGESRQLTRHPTALVEHFRNLVREGLPSVAHSADAPDAHADKESAMAKRGSRIERDSMGEMSVPSAAYYGASTQRAVLNFPISELRLQRRFIEALALIKYGAAVVNHKHGKLDAPLSRAICRAALEVARGKHDKHFVVDVFQTGSGTSTNMNMNEVIANRAIELLGGERGERSLVHPNDHVNMGMSSNDAIPSAMHIAALLEIRSELLPAVTELHAALQSKALSFAGIIKTGRTHLQDATPITLGQEFSGYAAQMSEAADRIVEASGRLSRVALGGTAVGTGVNTRADFASAVLAVVSQRTGLQLREAANHFHAQSTLDEVVHCSAALRTLALSLYKVANDVRWLGSGPRAGFGELLLPEVQPGSSIMPGKVNPVIAESVAQVVAHTVGNDAAIAFAAQSGNFELNVMQPVAAYNLLQSIALLSAACRNFARQCISGLQASERGPETVERGLALCTALVPAIGYDAAAAIAKEAHKTGRTVREVAVEKSGVPAERLSQLLDAFAMTAPESAPRLRIGITGSIACGKSAVGQMLVEMGALVIDTDHLGHELLAGPNAAYDAVLARFGADLVPAPGKPIDRAKLRRIVFADDKALSDLNAIMHPAINRLLDERMAAAAPGQVAVALVPLLFETGMQDRFDEVWTVKVDPQVQLERLMKRSALTEEQARTAIAKQWDQQEKIRRANRVIDNSGSLAVTRTQVKRRLSAAKKRRHLA